MPTNFYSKHHLPIHLHFHLGESGAVYLSHTIRSLALSLIGIFLPIYIFQLPNKVPLSLDPFINGATWVLLYFLFRSLFMVISTFLFGNWLFSKLHLRGSIFLSSILLSAEMSLWLLIGQQLNSGFISWSWLIILAGILSGLKIFFYWIPYHIFFIRKTDNHDNHYGRETGVRLLLVKLAHVLGPVVGGFVITLFGFNPLFITSIFLLIASTLPVLVSVSEHKHGNHDVIKISNQYLFNPKYAKISWAFAGSGTESVLYTIFWPILLFITLANFVKVGTITSISILLSSILVLWVGNITDKYGPKLVHGFGVLFNSLLYLPRIFLSSPLAMYTIDIFDRINGVLFGLPFMAVAYEKARRVGDSDFIIYRELAIHLPIIFITSFCILMLPYLSNWRWVFILAAIGSALTYLINLDEN